MKKTIIVLSIVLAMAMLCSSFALAAEGEETKIFGNLRLHYNKLYDDAADEWQGQSFGLHFLELRAQKKVGSVGVFVNHRIGDVNNNYLYEGWISFDAPKPIGTFKLGLVPVPFGIFANGLYFPKGMAYSKNWMWDYDYGLRYDGMFPVSEVLGVGVAAAYLIKENSAGELGAFSPAGCPACIGERNVVSGRVGANLNMKDTLTLKAGGSAQVGTLKREAAEDDTKVGIAGDVTISPTMLPIPVSVSGEFINYSLADADTAKGNILAAQLDVTPIQSVCCLDKAIVSLHLSMDTPTEGDSVTNLIAQVRLITAKQLHIFAQVYGNKIQDVDGLKGKGLRVWFMYVF